MAVRPLLCTAYVFLSVPGYSARDWSKTDSDSLWMIKEKRQRAMWLLNIDILSISIILQYAAVTHKVYYALCLINWDTVVWVLLIMRNICAFFMREKTFCDKNGCWLTSTDCLKRSGLGKWKRHALSFTTTTAALLYVGEIKGYCIFSSRKSILKTKD